LWAQETSADKLGLSMPMFEAMDVHYKKEKPPSESSESTTSGALHQMIDVVPFAPPASLLVTCFLKQEKLCVQ